MIKSIIKKLTYYKANMSQNAKVKYLREQGAKIGEETVLNCNTVSFGTEPYLIEVGKQCVFAAGVCLNTHDGGVAVLNHLDMWKDGIKRDKMGRIKIGNNVYIGINAIIMPGVEIGDNCVIGAGTIVTKSIPANSVAVGVPARIICSIEEYAEKAKFKTYPTGGMTKEEKKRFLIDKVK